MPRGEPPAWMSSGRTAARARSSSGPLTLKEFADVVARPHLARVIDHDAVPPPGPYEGVRSNWPHSAVTRR